MIKVKYNYKGKGITINEAWMMINRYIEEGTDGRQQSIQENLYIRLRLPREK